MHPFAQGVEKGCIGKEWVEETCRRSLATRNCTDFLTDQSQKKIA